MYASILTCTNVPINFKKKQEVDIQIKLHPNIYL